MAEAAKTAENARPAAPKGGKGAVMTARITAELRAALEAEAARTGRTLAQVAELWMEQARRGHVSLEELLETPGVGTTLRQLVRFAELIRGHGLDPATDRFARQALVQGWGKIIERTLPAAEPTADDLAFVQAEGVVRARAGDLLDALRDLAQTEPENEGLQRFLTPASNNALAAFQADYDPVDRASLVDLLHLIAARGEAAEGDSLTGSALAASRKASFRFFSRLYKQTDGLAEKFGDAGERAADALADLMEAERSVEVVQKRRAQQQREAQAKGAALVELISAD